LITSFIIKVTGIERIPHKKQKVETYLKELKVKMDIFGILFLDDRGKNQQTLRDL